jgi:hypothetical protein
MMMLRNLRWLAFRVLSGCCVLAVSAFSAQAQSLTFTTFAGPAGGAGSADGSGSAAHFFGPAGVATDNAGNVYVADSQNYTIRRITPAGVVTTLAGSAGLNGSTDGTGSAARFYAPPVPELKPWGVTTDSGGNVYVADKLNSTIRRITPAGLVTTLAGSAGVLGNSDGTGSAARFGEPMGVATDSSGNIYVADTLYDTIRKITPAGLVTTLAGSAGNSGSADGTGSAARFNSPSGVATDSGGNVYVADTDNDTIRKITPAGLVTTLAGSVGNFGSADGTGNTARFNSPSAVAADSGGNIYVADTLNSTIRKITPAGVVTTLAGLANGLGGSVDGSGSGARFDSPTGVATDIGGNVYVADTINNTIRKISPAGLVTTLAGSADSNGSADGTGGAARFYHPSGVATDGDGNVYVADNFNSTIRKITLAGVVTTLAGSATAFPGSQDGTGSAARFNSPSGVATDSGGNVYVADNNTVRKVSPVGVVTTLAGSADSQGSADGTGSAARFNAAAGVATDSGGNVYVADTFNHTIRKITPAGVVTTLAGSAGVSGNVDGTDSAARFNFPSGVATDSGGNVYVADTLNDTIRKITPAGVVTTLAGSATSFPGSADGTGSAARFNSPSGVATDSGGNVYVADTANNTIRKITPAGVVTTLAGSASGSYGSSDGTGSVARFHSPEGVAADAGGNLYAVDGNKIRIGRQALADTATIDFTTGAALTTRQLSTSTQTATSWQWRTIRQPSASTATFSSTLIRNPVFTPDVADLYIFQLTASDGVKTSITNVELTATPPKPGPRRRLVGH